MGWSNYPDGMRESDIPGWNDIECPLCEDVGEIVDGCELCDGRGMADAGDVADWRSRRG